MSGTVLTMTLWQEDRSVFDHEVRNYNHIKCCMFYASLAPQSNYKKLGF